MDLPRATNANIITPDEEDRQPANDLGGAVGDPPAIWAHLNEKASSDGQARNLTTTPTEVQSGNMFGLSLPQGNKTTIAKQTKEERRQQQHLANKTRASGVG